MVSFTTFFFGSLLIIILTDYKAISLQIDQFAILMFEHHYVTQITVLTSFP